MLGRPPRYVRDNDVPLICTLRYVNRAERENVIEGNYYIFASVRGSCAVSNFSFPETVQVSGYHSQCHAPSPVRAEASVTLMGDLLNVLLSKALSVSPRNLTSLCSCTLMSGLLLTLGRHPVLLRV